MYDKTYDNGELYSIGDSSTHTVLISDTTLWSFIPPQVRKMTPKLHNICGCKLFFIPKNINIDLNGSRTIILTYLQHKLVRRHTHKSLFSTKSSAYYKDKVFPDVEYLHATIKDASQFITRITIKLNNMIHIKCDLGSCDECTE